jgi:2-keto-4-pentenoate hydratase/2-oxohepta-3-ene-1,7-dioic acid hydratase in catechol pathway
MKILCIGRNYAAHIQELKNEVPAEPVFFLKPDTALLRNNEAFYIPDFSKDVHHEVEIVLKISKRGKHIPEKFAPDYFNEIGVGIDFTARDLQSKLKEKGLPWEKAKAFDGSAPVSSFVSKAEFADLNNLDFSLQVNDTQVQKGNTSLMLHNFNKIIAELSKYFTLNQGDLIFTGTPEGVAAVKAGDRLQAFIGDKKMLDFEVR